MASSGAATHTADAAAAGGRKPLPPALREELRETFAEDIERLGKLLDRDLGGWR